MDVERWASRSVWEWVFAAALEAEQTTSNAILGRGARRGCCNLALATKDGIFASTSPALDGLEDKDMFARTLQQFGIQALAPETQLVPWNATEVAFAGTLVPVPKSSFFFNAILSL